MLPLSAVQTVCANSAFHPSGVGKWVPALAGKAKAGMVYSVSGWTRGVQVKLWDPLRTRAIPERLRGVFTTRRYTNPRLPYLYLNLIKTTVRFHCHFVIMQSNIYYYWWRGGAVGRASDLRFIGCGFESHLGTIVQWPWANYLHLCASVTKQYDLVLAKARE